jgi:predicted DNA-binding transcriptional regulator AlpA
MSKKAQKKKGIGQSTTVEKAPAMPAKLLLTYDDVTRETGLSKVSIWRKYSTGKMPRPVSLGHKSPRWRYSDIKEWVEAGCVSVRSMKANPKPKKKVS